ncbi:Plug domain-containing protein, partial [Acinetobacter baumannii]
MKPLAALPLIFIAIQQVQAEERIAILKPLVFKANALKEKNYVVDKEKVESSNTIGDALKNITGIQSTSFGPNAGAPVIRSLSGNRVGVIENGEFINGMNAFSGNINIPFDPIFIEKVIVNKNTDNIRYGGNAIGGSVQIESGLIPKK